MNDLDEDDELEQTPPDVVNDLGFDPLEFDDEDDDEPLEDEDDEEPHSKQKGGQEANPASLLAFGRFVSGAADLLKAQANPCDDFTRFLATAKPVVAEGLGQQIKALRPRIERLSKWIIPDDLLFIAGLSYEDAYTKLIAWALSPPGHGEVALLCQKAWLEALGIKDAEKLGRHCPPRTQFITPQGRLDLVLDYQHYGFIIAVEAKTGSEEHWTPGDGMQSMIYPNAVRSALHLPEAFPVKMVFLTPIGASAENPEAINTTYIRFVEALATALPLDGLPPHLRWSYSLLFTHLLGHAAPNGNMVSALAVLNRLLEGEPSQELLFCNLRKIQPALAALGD